MLILSQDKKECVNIDNVKYFNVFNGNVLVVFSEYNYHNPDKEFCISCYEKNDEAKKVLMDILTAYSNGEKVFIMP